MRLVLIHNPGAGDGNLKPKKLRQLVGKAGEVVYQSTKQPHWQKVLEEPADVIVAAGGDGTVRRVALNAPLGSCIAILPLGTANNVAHSLGITGSPKDIVGSWAKARRQPLDLGRAAGPWGDRRFLEGLGLGAITQTAARMDAREALGGKNESSIVRARKTLSAVLGNGAAHWFEVSVDGEAICEKTMLLEIANMPFIGPRLALASMADPGDGRLDIIWAPEDSRQPLREWLSMASAEAHDAPVRACRGARVHIHHATGRVRLDDTYWPPEPAADADEVVPDIDIILEKGALRVLVPSAD